jgi:hypothetical protein
MLVMAEVMRVAVAATKVEMQAMTAKRPVETAGSAEAPGEMGRSRVAKVPSSAGHRNLDQKKNREYRGD